MVSNRRWNISDIGGNAFDIGGNASDIWWPVFDIDGNVSEGAGDWINTGQGNSVNAPQTVNEGGNVSNLERYASNIDGNGKIYLHAAGTLPMKITGNAPAL